MLDDPVNEFVSVKIFAYAGSLPGLTCEEALAGLDVTEGSSLGGFRTRVERRRAMGKSLQFQSSSIMIGNIIFVLTSFLILLR